ncbi:ROK family transcriptional regulator [[Clostridium] polysaccharolyticum]|uniref:Sugar kinase of the NBD/HSP70 family, may contain an N-terminal HTH domain n=1 Tax=[Clostridium] polysaccharolyticum TaxID=29364 RepID=A0A1H9ZHH0_9FIRM|nr:ROK family transcriptional regulator [[Clostridium] polysaccharolyticum]SES80765.1 Sugar kinase of the NBD/HSP70 family, may contain an N-terminal HTH domain [[Clostridium] polysaccharolyticum]
MIRGSKELIRNINCTNVLEEIITSDPISRAFLAKKLGLTKATISSIVQDLLNQKLVLEIGSDETKFGRKPILLSFNQKAGYAISIDLGDTIISASLTDLRGEAAQYKSIQVPEDPDKITECLVELIQSMEKLTSNSIYGIVGITIGIHGVVHRNRITYAKHFASHSDISNIDLINKLEQIFQIPVYIQNEANLSAIGEYTFKSTYDNIANLNIHNTVSLGMVLHNVLYTGNNGYAGSIGHMIVEPDGRQCSCGNHGCLEQYLSIPSLLQDYSEKIHVPDVTLADLFQGYEDKTPEAFEIMDQFVKYAAICVNNVMNLYNPDYFVINCALTNRFPSLVGKIQTVLNCDLGSQKKIAASSLNNSVLYGGICVAVREFLHISDFTQAEENTAHLF